MSDHVLTLRNSSLRALLAEARALVIKRGRVQQSARGKIYSVNLVKLVWDHPTWSEDAYWQWAKADVDHYLASFVDDQVENRPERLAAAGEMVFPYTYAARSRFRDSGWGYAVAVVNATRALTADVAGVLQSEAAFQAYLAQAGAMLHLQPLLAVWDWLGPAQLRRLTAEPEFGALMLSRTRSDQLVRIVEEIDADPTSRRAITASFLYPEIDHSFRPMYGVPPYQHFQLLPAAGKDEVLSSLHMHRSLDITHGSELDFHHDLRWLSYAAMTLQRSMGYISIVAGNLHVYVSTEQETAPAKLDEWLAKVTDGYRAGYGQVQELLQRTVYLHNVPRIYTRLRETI